MGPIIMRSFISCFSIERRMNAEIEERRDTQRRLMKLDEICQIQGEI
jgi:hypothetical protein